MNCVKWIILKDEYKICKAVARGKVFLNTDNIYVHEKLKSTDALLHDVQEVIAEELQKHSVPLIVLPSLMLLYLDWKRIHTCRRAIINK